MTTLFDNQQQKPPLTTIEEGKYRETLVGEGKKFKDDEALARGKWESDNHIARLEAELAEARGEIHKRITIEEALAEIKASAKQAPSSPEAHQPGEQVPPTNANKQLTQEELDAFLEAKLNKRQEQEVAVRNIEQVKRELSRVWGPQARSHLETKLRELEVTQEYADSLAARSPKALLKLLGVEGAPTSAAPSDLAPPRGSISAPTGGTNKTWSFYQKMLRDNPKQYHSKQTQLEIYKQAQAMGADFYN